MANFSTFCFKWLYIEFLRYELKLMLVENEKVRQYHSKKGTYHFVQETEKYDYCAPAALLFKYGIFK